MYLVCHYFILNDHAWWLFKITHDSAWLCNAWMTTRVASLVIEPSLYLCFNPRGPGVCIASRKKIKFRRAFAQTLRVRFRCCLNSCILLLFHRRGQGVVIASRKISFRCVRTCVMCPASRFRWSNMQLTDKQKVVIAMRQCDNVNMWQCWKIMPYTANYWICKLKLEIYSTLTKLSNVTNVSL